MSDAPYEFPEQVTFTGYEVLDMAAALADIFSDLDARGDIDMAIRVLEIQLKLEDRVFGEG